MRLVTGVLALSTIVITCAGVIFAQSSQNNGDTELSEPLAEAEAALAENWFREAAEAFEAAGGDKSLPPAVRARAYRGKAVAHSASLEQAETVRALTDAVIADPASNVNSIIMQTIFQEISVTGRPEGWERRLKELASAVSDRPELESDMMRLNLLDFEMTGRFDEADKLISNSSLLNDFIILGPFDNAGGSGIDQQYPPELGVQTDATYTDRRGRAIRWMRVPSHPRGVIDVDVALDSEPDAIAYLLTHVKVPEDTRAQIRMAGGASVRIWLNQELILDEPEFRSSVTDLYKAPLSLRKGWNRLLVKVGAEDESLSLSLYLTDSRGRQLRFDASRDPSVWQGSRAVASYDAGAPSLPRGLERFPEGDWLRQWKSSVQELSLGDCMMLVDFLLKCSFLDEAEEAIEVLADRFPGAALVEQQRALLLFARESGDDIGVIGRAAVNAPELVSARVALVGKLLDQNRPEEAQKEIDDTIRLVGAIPTLQALRGLLRMTGGMPNEGLADAKAAWRANPGDLLLREIYFTALDLQNLKEERCEEAKAALKARPDDGELAREVAAIYYEESKYDDAIKCLERAIRAGSRPDVVYSEMATVYESTGDLDEAEKALEKGLYWSQMSSSITEQIGTLQLKRERKDEAVGYLKRHIELDPTAFETRELIRRIEQEPPLRDYFPKHDVNDLLKMDVSWIDSSAVAVRLADVVEVIRYRDGAYEERRHLVTKILTQGGVEFCCKADVPLSVHYDGGIEIARTIKPDGREVEAEVGFSEVAFGELEPGDVTEISVVTRYGPVVGLARHFWHDFEFQGDFPSNLSRFAILLPSDWEYKAQPHGVEIEPMVSNHDEWRLEVWEQRNVPMDVGESYMPPDRERVSWLDISTVPSWNTIVDWYDGLSRGRIRANAAVRAKARELAAGASSDSALVHRVGDFVKQNIRYEGGEFSESAQIPRPAAKVLQSQYGDCKDQVGLTVCLLREMGVDARFALVNSRSNTTVPYLPSTRFSHAVVRARTPGGEVFWIDPTAADLAFPNVPVELEGAKALLIDPENPSFVTIDIDPAETNGSNSVIRAELAEDGGLDLVGSCQYIGEDASRYRSIMLYAPERKDELITEDITAEYPGASVTDIKLAAESLDRPVVMSYSMKEPYFASFAGDLMIVELPWVVTRVPKRFCGLGERKHALVIDSWKGRYTERIDLRVPRGFTAMSDFKNVELSCSIGRFSLKGEWVDDGLLVLERKLELDAFRVEPADYPEFCRFLDDARRAEQEQLVLRQTLK